MDEIFHIEPYEKFKEVSDCIINYLYNSKESSVEDVRPELIKLAKSEVKQMLLESSFDLNKVKEIIIHKDFNKNKTDYFTLIMQEKKIELLYEILVHHNSKFGETLLDFDWNLKLIFGSSELKTLRYPLLQLIFITLTSREEKKQQVFDLNKDIVSKMINVLENINEIK